MEILICLGVMAAVGIFMGGMGILMIAHRGIPKGPVYGVTSEPLRPMPYEPPANDEYDPDNWKR